MDIAADGQEGLFMAESNAYDAVLLDLMLPKLDGMTLLGRIRQSGQHTPVLVLTARDDKESVVALLNAGNRRAARMAMMAITSSSSIKVNAAAPPGRVPAIRAGFVSVRFIAIVGIETSMFPRRGPGVSPTRPSTESGSQATHPVELGAAALVRNEHEHFAWINAVVTQQRFAVGA